MINSSSIIILDRNPAGFGDNPDELDPTIFASELPTQHSHAFFEDDTLGLYVGLWDTNDMIEAPGPYACDEFMLLIEGEVQVKDNQTGEFTKVVAGDAFVLPKGYDCQWHQQGYLRKFYVISEHPEESVPEQAAEQQTIIITRTPANNGVTDSILFPTIDAACTETLSYVDTLGRFSAGVWHSAAVDSQTVMLNHYALLCVRTGVIALATAGGEKHNVSAGQSCFIPSNAELELSVSKETTIQFCTVKA
ncbi:MAG: cupin domain-containing protein [Pseudomonadales bacterium]